MVNPSANPFVLPGFGQGGDLSQNPMLASLEMMRQAWQSMAGGALDHSLMAAPMSPEELERRIQELRTVENWLRMNLSMLTSTIQGLEVQRATLTTLRSFVESATAAGTSSTAEALSPLEAVLGLRKSASAPKAPAQEPPAATSGWPDPPAARAASEPVAPSSSDAAGTGASATAAGEAALAGAAAAAQGWWDMLQKQFDTLAAATSATLHSAEAMKAASAQAADSAVSAASAPATAKSAAKKAAPRKTAARKTTATRSRKTPPADA